jgi:hypothetical protein
VNTAISVTVKGVARSRRLGGRRKRRT